MKVLYSFVPRLFQLPMDLLWLSEILGMFTTFKQLDALQHFLTDSAFLGVHSKGSRPNLGKLTLLASSFVVWFWFSCAVSHLTLQGHAMAEQHLASVDRRLFHYYIHSNWCRFCRATLVAIQMLQVAAICVTLGGSL